MATVNFQLRQGHACERCAEGHLEVVVKSADIAYVICDHCHTVWATKRPKGEDAVPMLPRHDS